MGFFDFIFGGLSSKYGSVSAETERKIQSEWNNIRDLLKGGSPSQLRQSLIAADKCLDNALRDMVAGEGMAERLKNIKEKFDRDTYSNIWNAHKVRNNLVHEAGYEPPHYVIKESVESLKTALLKLGVRI